MKNLWPHKCQKEPASFPRTLRTDEPFPRLGHFAGVGALRSVSVTNPPQGGQARAHVPRTPPRCSSRTHPGAALLHRGHHSQGAGRTRAEVEEVQRRARRLLQEPALELWVLAPPGVLGPCGPRETRGRRRRPLEGEQQQQCKHRGGGAWASGPGRQQQLPAGLHGHRRASAAQDGLGAATPALEEIKSQRAPPLRPRDGRLQGARVPTRPRPLGTSRSPWAPPPRPAWAPAAPAQSPDSAAPPRRGAGGVRLGPRGQGIEGGSGDSSPEGARPTRRHPWSRPQPKLQDPVSLPCSC